MGYLEQNIYLFTNNKPTPYQENNLGKFQGQCKWKDWTCIAFFGYPGFVSSLWIDAIQYVARDVDTSNPSDITNRFWILFDSNPHRYYPYILIQYLWNPSSQTKDLTWANISYNNVIHLGEKGIKNYCDSEKIQKIENLTYSEFITAIYEKNPEYRKPCKEWWELVHTVAFNYFYYLHDSISSIKYYKVASFHDDVPAITISMPALIEGKEWNNKISAYLWYDNYQRNLLQYTSDKKLEQDEITNLESTMEKAIQKMIVEYSLYILTQATEQAKFQEEDISCQHDISCLERKWYNKNIIKDIINNCKENQIDCEIISFGIDRQLITPSWKLIGIDNMRYLRDREKWLRILDIL